MVGPEEHPVNEVLKFGNLKWEVKWMELIMNTLSRLERFQRFHTDLMERVHRHYIHFD